MTQPHRDNPPRVAARCPSDHHQAAAQLTNADETRLTVITPLIRGDGMPSIKHQCRLSEIETSILERPLALIRIERDTHDLT
jgi:hypothetical protein